MGSWLPLAISTIEKRPEPENGRLIAQIFNQTMASYAREPNIGNITGAVVGNRVNVVVGPRIHNGIQTAFGKFNYHK